MQYKKTYTFERIDQDIAPDKRASNTQFNVTNMEAFLTSRNASLQTAKGTQVVPSQAFLDGVFVIGDTIVEKDLYIWVTTNQSTPNGSSSDAVYKVTITDLIINMSLASQGNWFLSTLNPIQSLGIQETTDMRKLYWVDAFNQARYLAFATGISLALNTEVDFVRPNPTPGVITATEYGVPGLINAKVRYGYTQYDTRQSESKLSYLTSPVNIGKDFNSVQVTLNIPTPVYNNYRIYRVMWETYLDSPTFALVKEGEVPASGIVNLIDNGTSFITSLSDEEYFDLGSDYIIPATLEAKKQILFLGNYKADVFKLPVGTDMRAFQFDDTPGTLDPPVAIPADTEVQGIYPAANLVYNTGTEQGWLVECDSNSNPEKTTTISNMIPLDGKTLGLRRHPDGGDYIYCDIYDGTYVPGVTTNRLGTLQFGSGVEHIISYNIVAAFYDLFFYCTGSAGSQDAITQIYVAKGITTQLDIVIPHTAVPDDNGWSYTGVTGFDTPSIASFSEDLLIFSADFAVDSIANGGGSSTLTYIFPGALTISGGVVAEGTLLYPNIALEPLGTRQAITGAGLKLDNEDGTDLRSYTNYDQVGLLEEAVNPDPDLYIYQADATTLGAEGPFTKIWLEEVPTSIGTDFKLPIHRSGEIYRVGVVCQDQFGRSTYTNWVGDFKIPKIKAGSVGTPTIHHVIKGTLKTAPAGVIMYKFVMVKRLPQDKTVLSQGVVQPLMEYFVDTSSQGVYPFPNAKEVNAAGRATYTPGAIPDETFFDIRIPYSPANISHASPHPSFPKNIGRDFDSDITDLQVHNTSKCVVITPDTLLTKNDIPGTKLRAVGVQEINSALDATRLGYWDPDIGSGSGDEETSPFINFNIYDFFSPQPTGAARFMFEGDHNAPEQTDQYSLYMFSRQMSHFLPIDDGQVEVYDLDYAKYVALDSSVLMGGTVLSNTINAVDFAKMNSASPANYEAEYIDCLAIEIPDPGGDENWHKRDTKGTTEQPWSLFCPVAWEGYPTQDRDTRGLPIVDILQEVPSQYGGQSNNAKSLNFYIDASTGSSDFSNAPNVTLIGDTYIGEYAIPKTTGAREFGNGKQTAVFDYFWVYLESEVAIYAANLTVKDMLRTLGFSSNTMKFIEVENLLDSVDVYSQLIDQNLYPALRYNSPEVFEFTTRVTPSTVKIAGESVDSWTKINTLVYIDLEAVYGAISILIRVGNDMIAFQHRAIASIQILPNTQTTTQTGTIQLGKGKVLDDFSYISVENGTENFQCVEVYGQDVYFIDTVNKVLMALKGGELSALKGFNSVVKELTNSGVSEYLLNNPAGGFVTVRDELKQVLFRFSEFFPVLVYNPITQSFIGTRTYSGYYFMRYYDNTLSADAVSSKLYVHDKGAIADYYGVHQDASIEMWVEPIPNADKVFDAVTVLKAGDSNFETITVTSPTRTSGKKVTEFRSKFDKHTTHLPRVENSQDRFRERNIKIKLDYAGTTILEVDEIIVKFTIKKR